MNGLCLGTGWLVGSIMFEVKCMQCCGHLFWYPRSWALEVCFVWLCVCVFILTVGDDEGNEVGAEDQAVVLVTY